MKKYLINAIFTLVLLGAMPILVTADGNQFNTYLYFGINNPSEVIKLQNFLISQNLLDPSLATGNFLSLTRAAVMAFQKNNGIEAIGYFGPLTRAVANKIILAQSVATISPLAVKNANSGVATVNFSNQKIITWQTSGYPEGVGININLIRKISDSPKSFNLVRIIATNTPNDGQENWIPQSGETSNDMYIEIACSNTYKFIKGCQLSGGPIKVN